jgi:hypothetical protein
VTEAEWLIATDPMQMVEFLQGKVSDRKLRLFACACCRRIWERLEEGGCHAVEIAERFADGLADSKQLVRARHISEEIREFTGWGGEHACAWSVADKSAWQAAEGAARTSVVFSREWDLAAQKANRTHNRVDREAVGAIAKRETDLTRKAQVTLLRDTFGNPFRPVVIDPAWLTSTVLALAEGIYQDRAFNRLPILADALMDAGCDNDDVLSHCRQPSEHVRGCWVIDLLTGRK